MEPIMTIAVAGAVGGFVKSLIEQKGAVMLPEIEVTQDGTRYVHGGFVTNLIIGAVGAVISATTLVAALTAGMSSAFLLEKAIERAKEVPAMIPGLKR